MANSPKPVKVPKSRLPSVKALSRKLSPVQVTNLREALEVLRNGIPTADLSQVSSTKLLAAYLMYEGYAIPTVAKRLGLEAHVIHFWLAHDEEFRRLLDHFSEALERETYMKAMVMLRDMLHSEDIDLRDMLTLIDLAIRARRTGDMRASARESTELKKRELDARLARMQEGHQATFTWMADIEQIEDADFSVEE